MNQENYLKAIIKDLKCSKEKKLEIKRELESDIQTALASGESWQEIKERMGEPKEIAKEFNANQSYQEMAALKRKRRFKVLGIIVVILICLITAINWVLPKSGEIGENSIFKEETVIKQAEAVIDLVNQDNYTAIQAQYANERLKQALDEEKMIAAKEQIGSDWGAFSSYTSVYSAQLKQMGKTYALAQITALYENRSVTYTISFDQDMKLAGLFMK